TVFASLRGPDIPQASGLINLTRQLGGSFGIAVLNTYIADQTAYHRTNLVAHLDSANAAFASQQTGLAHQFMAHGYGLETAKNMALSVIDGRLEAQAMTMSYNDAFLLLMVSFIVTAPAVFLLKKPKAAKPAAMGGH
ncbi:MAG: MFS transporter, partial [Armatimonadota bacterium]|nr:MFS transporter [Armatimonadota bacterium]